MTRSAGLKRGASEATADARSLLRQEMDTLVLLHRVVSGRRSWNSIARWVGRLTQRLERIAAARRASEPPVTRNLPPIEGVEAARTFLLSEGGMLAIRVSVGPRPWLVVTLEGSREEFLTDEELLELARSERDLQFVLGKWFREPAIPAPVNASGDAAQSEKSQSPSGHDPAERAAKPGGGLTRGDTAKEVKR